MCISCFKLIHIIHANTHTHTHTPKQVAQLSIHLSETCFMLRPLVTPCNVTVVSSRAPSPFTISVSFTTRGFYCRKVLQFVAQTVVLSRQYSAESRALPLGRRLKPTNKH